jgi:hypothetical protein
MKNESDLEGARRPYVALCDDVEMAGGHVRLIRDAEGFALVVDLPTSAKLRRFRFGGLSFSTISDLDDVADALRLWVAVTERRKKSGLSEARDGCDEQPRGHYGSRSGVGAD